jgi:hypothetical protein
MKSEKEIIDMMKQFELDKTEFNKRAEYIDDLELIWDTNTEYDIKISLLKEILK